MARYKVVLEPEPEGGYSASVPALPGCASQGETRDEALANVREAIDGYLAVMREDGLTPPADSTEITEVEVRAA